MPVELPNVELDETENECAAGWNFTKDIKTGLLIAGLWPTGRPSRVFEVESIGKLVERGDKNRTDKLAIISEVGEGPINDAIGEFSKKSFGEFAEEMTLSQIAWRLALSRPRHDEGNIEAGLREALDVRGLKDWKLKKYDTAMAAMDARAAMAAMDAWAALAARGAWDALDAMDARAALDALDAMDAWAARGAWDALDAMDARAALDALDAMDAWAARAALDALDAWAALDAGGAWAALAARGAWAALAARGAWAALAAWAALTIQFSSNKKWANYEPDYLTRGIRDAYLNGLEIAIPTGEKELGWSSKK
jgi:hypothetical protein